MKKSKPVGFCLFCGKEVLETGLGFSCKDKNCNFILWKKNKFLEKIGKKMNRSLASSLLSEYGNKVSIGKIKSAKGNLVEALLSLVVESDKTLSYNLDFPAIKKVEDTKLDRWK